MSVRQLDVTVYTSPTSTTVLRDRSGGASAIKSLRFSSGLPGGFLEASFVVVWPASQTWPIAAGQKVEIRRGRQVVWWGWVEDVTQRARGRSVELQVMCLGPWQELQQRNIALANYTSDQHGGSAIRMELGANCPSISADYSQIMSTGVSIGPLVKRHWPVAELVKLVLDTGDAAGNRLLFAIWEPPTREEAVDVLRSRNVCLNSNFDGPTWYGWTVDAYANGDYEIINTTSVSPTRSGKVYSTSAVSAGNVTLDNVYADATPSATYRFEYSFYFPALIHGSFRCRVGVGWWDSSDTLISFAYGSWHTSTGVAGWTSAFADFAAPVNAAHMKGYLIAEWPAGTAYYVGWDECYLSRLVASESLATKPRAMLWARDLSDYDFNLWTYLLDDPLEDTTTTRDVVNAVTASYASSSYTARADDAASQALYRRRDYLLAAGSEAGVTLAEQLRDAYLAQHASPSAEVGSFALSSAGAITTRRNRPVDLADVRAGQRLRLADGPRAGAVMLLSAVEWADGVLRCTPEGDYSLPQMVA